MHQRGLLLASSSYLLPGAWHGGVGQLGAVDYPAGSRKTCHEVQAYYGFSIDVSAMCTQVDELDYAIRKKDPSKANAILPSVQSALDTAIAAVA